MGGGALILTVNQVPLTDGSGNASAITISGPVTLPANITVDVTAGVIGVSALVTVKDKGVTVQGPSLLSGVVALVGSLVGLQLDLTGVSVVVLQTYTLRLP